MWVKCYTPLSGWAIDHLLSLPLSLKTILKATCLRWWHEKMEGIWFHMLPLEGDLLDPNVNEKYILVLLSD